MSLLHRGKHKCPSGQHKRDPKNSDIRIIPNNRSCTVLDELMITKLDVNSNILLVGSAFCTRYGRHEEKSKI